MGSSRVCSARCRGRRGARRGRALVVCRRRCARRGRATSVVGRSETLTSGWARSPAVPTAGHPSCRTSHRQRTAGAETGLLPPTCSGLLRGRARLTPVARPDLRVRGAVPHALLPRPPIRMRTAAFAGTAAPGPSVHPGTAARVAFATGGLRPDCDHTPEQRRSKP